LTKYYYRMKSINTSGVESGMSNQVEVRPNTPPNAPSNLKFVPGPHMVGLTWKPSTSSNVSYVVYRASKNEPNAIRATTSDSVLMDKQTQDWTSYTYQVRAIDTVGVKSTSFIEVKAFANKIWYIDTAGNDSNGFKGHPWYPAKNYQKLVDISSFKSGDTILLKPGVYKTNIDVAHSNGNYSYKDMTIGSYYMINGDTNAIRKTVLDGSSYYGTNAFIQVGQSKFNLIGLTVYKTNAQALQYNSAHKALSTVKRVKFLNCGNSTVWGTVAIWGYVRIDSCEFLGSKGRYLVAQGSSTSIIRNSTFINNGWNQTQDCGVIFSERGGQVYNNIITGNGMPALVLGGNAALDTVLWIHNTIYNNNSYGLYFQNWGGGNIAYIENNIVEGNKPNAYFNNSGFSYLFFSNNFIKPFLGDSATNKNAYPMPLYYKFSQNNVDSVSKSYLPASIKNSSDLKLGAYSPLLGMGKSTYVKTDMIGQSRPNPTGSSPDLGALESAYELPGPYIDSVRTLGDTVYTYVKVLRPDKSNYLYTRYYDTAGTQKGLDSTKLSASKTNYVVKNYSLSNGRLYTVQSDLNKSSIGKSNIRKVAIMVKPDMYSPSNQATMVDTAKSLKWWPSPYAQKYRVQLSSSSTFATTLLDRIVSGDSVKPSGLKLNRTYYWRTLSIDSQGRSLWSNAFTYQTEVQKARIDSLRYSPSTLKLHFSIQDTFNVAKFYVYRDTSANAFDLIDSVSASARIFVDSFVDPGLRYYYRLKVVNKQRVVSNFGPERAINILNRPVLSNPLEEQDSVAWTSSFTWTKAAQAQKSEFELYRWEGSSSLISQKVLSIDTITVASLKQNRYHTWRVRALDSCGRSEWSDTFRMQTKVAATKITQVKSYVAHIDLTWQLADTFNVKDYVIYRDTTANGLTVLDSVAYTGTSYRDSSLAAGVRYYYQIRVRNRQGSMSDPSLMRSASVLEAPILVKPVDLKTNESRSPMHDWKKVKYATKYRVQVASDSQMVTILANSLQTPDSFAMSNLKYSTYYYWKVRAEDSTGYGAWSERRVYQTQVQTPVLTSLNSKETQVEVKWTLADTTNAGSFVIYRDTFANPTTAIDSVPSWQRNYFDNSAQEDTRYFYRVALKNKQSVYGPKSNQKAINVLIKASIAMPLNKELNVSVGPLFDWDSERFVNKYRIQVSQDPNFGTKAKDTAVGYSSVSLATFKKNTNYYWHVRCEDSLGYGRWSDTFMYQTELDVPVLFTLSTTHKAIKLNWKLYDTTNYANLEGYYIYRDTAKDASVLIDSVGKGISTFTDTTVALATMNYYRIKAYNKQEVKSEFSNENRAAALHYPDLVSPIDTAKRVMLSTYLKWTQERYATKYKVQVSYDTAVANPFFDKTVNNVDSTLISLSRWNYFYYWRVRAEDSLGISRWSDVFEYQTKLFKPSIDTTVAGNKKIRLTWQRSDTQNIKEYKIYRDTTSNNPKYIATVTSVDGKLSYTYLDSGLVNFKTYYYWITAVNNQHVESDKSGVRFNTTFNISPFAYINKDTLFENVGRNSRVKRYFLQTAAYDKDGWVDSIVWYVDDIRVAQDDSLKYKFRQGTTKVRAVVFDNDQATDTNTFYVSQLTYRKKFRTGIVAGVSVFNENEIYVADTSLNSFNLGEVLRIDTLGNTTFNYLVSDRIRTTPSFDYSGNMFLTNGVNLNSFTNSGAPLFNEMALGGLSFVTPTLDSVLGRVYVGVSNRKLFAIDVDNGGKIKWDFTADAPMAAPAVITAGRKLIFPDVSGKLYGFDVTYSYSPKTGDAPKWKWTGSDSIMLAPAIDTLENVIVGTTTGKLLKLEFDSTGKINTKWSTNLGSKVTTSAVLDAYGRIYVGCKNGYLYCLKSSNGDTLWSFNTGATILSTPTLSDQNRIYVANMNGHVYALDTGRKIMWFYLGNEPVQSHLVHVNGATYIPTLGGSLKTIYDAGILNDISTIKSQVTPRGNKLLVPKPIWGTYQGNYRRTGLQDGIFKVVPDKPADQSSVRVYPNPSSNFFRLESLFGVRTVEFLDISGRSVETLNLGLATQSVIDVASYRPGIYFLKVSTEKGMVTKRVVITH